MKRFDYELDSNSGEYEIVDHKQGSVTVGVKGLNPIAVVYDLGLAELMVDALNDQSKHFNRRVV